VRVGIKLSSIEQHLFHFLPNFQPSKVNPNLFFNSKDLDFTQRVYPRFQKFFSCLSSPTTASIKPFWPPSKNFPLQNPGNLLVLGQVPDLIKMDLQTVSLINS
jgi:hypothetical protein